MKKLITLVLIGFVLSGCSLIHVRKMNIEQGNIITPQQVSRLHAGMTEAQVSEVMGNPIMMNIFTPHRIEYVYTFKPGHGEMSVKRLTCLFQGGRLREIKGF